MPTPNRVLQTFLAIYLSLFAGAFAQYPQLKTVDSLGDVGSYSSLAIDHQQRRIAAWFDKTNGNLKFGILIDGVWMAENVDTTGVVGTYCSLAYDNTTRTPVISYYGGRLKIARKINGNWAIADIDSSSSAGTKSQLVVDSARGKAHVIYWRSDTWQVMLATTSNYQTWSFTEVDVRKDHSSYFAGQGQSTTYLEAHLAIGLNPTTGAVMLGQSSVVRTFNSDGVTRAYTEWRVKVPTAQNWTIWKSHYTASNVSGGLNYSTKNPISLAFNPVTNSFLMGASIGVNDTLEVLSGPNQSETVQANFTAGENSLAVDAAGNRWIAYYDETDHDAKLAKRVNTTLVPTDLGCQRFCWTIAIIATRCIRQSSDDLL